MRRNWPWALGLLAVIGLTFYLAREEGDSASLWPDFSRRPMATFRALPDSMVVVHASWLFERWSERARMEEALAGMPGYHRTNRFFAVVWLQRTGACLLPPGISFELRPRSSCLVDEINWIWEDPRDDPVADFNSFLVLWEETARELERRPWLREWKQAGPRRSIKLFLTRTSGAFELVLARPGWASRLELNGGGSGETAWQSGHGNQEEPALVTRSTNCR